MKILNIFVLVTLLLPISISCVQSGQTKDEFEVSNFTAIRSSVVGNIEIRQASQTSVTAEGSEALLDLLNVKMDNQTLVLKMAERRMKRIKNSASKLTIYVSTPNLTYIDFEGVSNITIKGNFNTPELTIESDGVGNMNVDYLNVGNVKIDSEGVGNINIGGKAKKVNISSGGIGNINTRELITPNAFVKSVGVGNISCYASEFLQIESNAIGNVTYYGKPKETSFNKKGIGKIKAGN